jgi:chorismate dehydratase
MTPHKVRIGAPYYLCARPLLFGLTRSPEKNVELQYHESGTLAEMLERGLLDAALIPSIEYLRGIGNHFIKGPALVASIDAGAVLLVTKTPIGGIERVAVDEFCRTPIAALRIVLDGIHHILPDICVSKNVDMNWRERYDAVLLNGDRALHYLFENKARAENEKENAYDLGRLWHELTGSPLVDSLWAYNDEALEGFLGKVFHSSRNLGLSNMSLLAKGLASSLPFDPAFLKEHLSERWSYDMGEEEMEGLRLLEEHSLTYELLRERRLAEPALSQGQ